MLRAIASSACLVLLAACDASKAPTTAPSSTEAVASPSASEPATNAAATPAAEADLRWKGLCEFEVRKPVPAGAKKIGQSQYEIDGDPVYVHEYEACGGKAHVFVEIKDDIVAYLDIRRNGDCIPDLACVGELFQNVAKRFPRAEPFGSLIDQPSMGLEIDQHARVLADLAGMPNDCFSRPQLCLSKPDTLTVTAVRLSK